MTIGGWVVFGLFALLIFSIGGAIAVAIDNKYGTAACALVAAALTVGLLFGMRWYFANTASGQRALVDQRSDLNNGLNRTITVYTADGNEIARYEGKIDISSADGYVKFDYQGKRYIYYNCFVEAIADISGGDGDG